MTSSPTPRMTFPLRRLLVLPAIALVALASPVLATIEADPGTATTAEVPVAPDGATVDAGWSSEATPVDGQVMGVTWDGDPEASFTIEVHQDGAWVPGTEIEAAGGTDEGTKDAASAAQAPDNATEPIWVGEDVDQVRVRLDDGQATDVSVTAVDTGQGSAPGGSAGASAPWLPDLQGPQRYLFAAVIFGAAGILALFALGIRPRRRNRLTVAVVVAGLALVACAPVTPPGDGSTQPPIATRDQWGARPFSCAGGPEYAPKLEFAVVHHTVNSNSYTAEQVPGMVRGIQAYHMDANGYCDIAYHFIVDRFGWIYEGRAGGMTLPVIGGHSGGFNTGSTSAALLGDFSSVGVSTPMWNSLVHLLRWRMTVGGVNPNAPFDYVVKTSPCNCQHWPPGTMVHFPVSLLSHRDVDQTACPGNGVWNNLGALRDQVAAGWISTTTAAAVTTETAPPVEASTTTSTTTTTTAPPTTTTTQPAP